jgi:hypothetical protein
LAFVRERALRDEVSLLNDAKREGLEEGEQLGVEKGRLAEAREVVRTQLTFKFGEVPEWVEAKLVQADHDQLAVQQALRRQQCQRLHFLARLAVG